MCYDLKCEFTKFQTSARGSRVVGGWVAVPHTQWPSMGWLDWATPTIGWLDQAIYNPGHHPKVGWHTWRSTQPSPAQPSPAWAGVVYRVQMIMVIMSNNLYGKSLP